MLEATRAEGRRGRGRVGVVVETEGGSAGEQWESGQGTRGQGDELQDKESNIAAALRRLSEAGGPCRID